MGEGGKQNVLGVVPWEALLLWKGTDANIKSDRFQQGNSARPRLNLTNKREN